MSLVKQFWTADAEPENKTLTQLLYEIRKDDEAGQIFDAVEMSDIEAFADEILETPMFDALITPFSKLERKMNVMLSVMKSAAQEVKPTSVTISKPFKKYNSVQVGVVFTLSDEQTITIFFHNPDTTPTKLSPTDDLVSWKWLLNKKDVTIIVAPEHGKDLNVREVARRLMKIAEKNSAAFLRQNANLKARKEQIEKDTKEIEELEKELASVLEEIKFLEEDNAKRKENIKNLTEKVEAEKAAQQEEQEKQAEEEQAKAEKEAKEEPEPEPKDQVATPTNTDEDFLRGIIDGSINGRETDNMNRLGEIVAAHGDEADPLYPLLDKAMAVVVAASVAAATKVVGGERK